ncbi:hypothetical protein JR334_05825 [Clostridia bacterium]|nr:hypothetical protein JR334_05825 [Clostridia bacterium]
MWFDNLMDDFKQSLLTCHQYKAVFVPVFLRLAMHIVLGILMVIGLVTSLASGTFRGLFHAKTFDVFVRSLLGTFRPIGFSIVLVYIVYLVLWSMIEVGSISLIKTAIQGIKPSKKHFIGGIRVYMGKVFSGKLIIHLLVLLSTPIWFLAGLLYFILIAIPTGGWGSLFLATFLGALFLTWTTAIVEDDLGTFEGIKASLRLAKNHMQPVFLISLLSFFLIGYFSMILGPMVFFFAGWFLGGIIRILLKVATYLTYVRYSDGGKNKEIILD